MAQKAKFARLDKTQYFEETFELKMGSLGYVLSQWRWTSCPLCCWGDDFGKTGKPCSTVFSSFRAIIHHLVPHLHFA